MTRRLSNKRLILFSLVTVTMALGLVSLGLTGWNLRLLRERFYLRKVLRARLVDLTMADYIVGTAGI